MVRTSLALLTLAVLACCIAADGPIKSDNSVAGVDLEPTSSRNMLILGIRTHEAKRAAADQVKANANAGTAKGAREAAKAQKHAGRAGVPIPGVTAPAGRHLLQQEEAAERNLLILGIKTHEAKKAAKEAVKANTHARRAGLTTTPAATTASGRHLLEEEEAAARNLLIFGYKTHEAKKAAKEAVKAQSAAKRAGFTTSSTTAGRHLLEEEAAARNLLILGIKTHEAKKAAKEAVKANTHARRAGLTTTPSSTGRRMLQSEDDTARKLLILGIRTHEAKRAAADQVKANANAGTAKGAREAAKAQKHAARSGVPIPGVTAGVGAGRRL